MVPRKPLVEIILNILTALECTKFVFGRGCAPDPAGGAYSASPDSIAGLIGLLLRGREKERRREGERREREGPPYANSWICP